MTSTPPLSSPPPVPFLQGMTVSDQGAVFAREALTTLAARPLPERRHVAFYVGLARRSGMAECEIREAMAVSDA